MLPSTTLTTYTQAQPFSQNTQNTIEIGTLQAFLGVAAIILSIGIAWGTLRTLVKGIKQTLDDKIEPDLKNVRERFVIVEDRVDTIWKDRTAPAHSPRQLNERGDTILNGSGIKEIIEEKKNQLLELIRTRNIANAYDAEIAVLKVAEELPVHCPDVVVKLKEGAFKVGATLDDVLFVGGIHLRNLVFSDLGFRLTDLDKPQINATTTNQ